jgi:hypothetical protein
LGITEAKLFEYELLKAK